MISAYISGIGVLLPNAPVTNAEIENVLGPINGIASRTKRLILRNNGILTRHYAIDPATGRPTHTNAQLTAEAVRALARSAGFSLDAIDCLVCATSSPDQWIPNHGLMVHGELKCPPCEVVATSGVCASGMTALKYAWMSVLTGQSRRAVATASEVSSSVLHASQFPARAATEPLDIEKTPLVAFDQEFLRWMLSDGAGAVCVTPAPAAVGLSLRIEWIDLVSFANETEPCMYWGGRKRDDGVFEGWRQTEDPLAGLAHGAMNVSQDAKLLAREIGVRTVDAFTRIRGRREIAPEKVDWFVPHYSSQYFKRETHDRFAAAGFPIPYEK